MDRESQNSMNTADAVDAQVKHLAVMILPVGGAAALNPLQEVSRFERMAYELAYAIQHTNGAEMTALMGHLASDGGSAVVCRVSGLWDLAANLFNGTVSELEDLVKAYKEDQFVDHLGRRVKRGVAVTTDTVSRGAKSLYALRNELLTNPADAAPKLLVLVLSSVAASGGVDGNGGVPDLDIPLMGIGAHRSPFTHSILIGSLLEAALLLLTRIVRCTYKNLPEQHDPLWERIARQSENILRAAGKGASIGIAYHLMVDAVVQPGAYHGVPFDMPMEAHQMILAANSAAEATGARSYPGEEVIIATPEILALHKKYRAERMPIPNVLQEFLTPTDVVILTTYGVWLQALAKRDIVPTTLAQVQFLKVADCRCAPVSEHEKAWMAFVNAKRRSGWTMTT